MKLYWKIYLVLALTTLVTITATSWISFSILPARFEKQRIELVESFSNIVMNMQNPTRPEIEALADSMNIGLRFIRNSQRPQGGHGFPPEEREWRSVQLIHLPGKDFSMLAVAKINHMRLLPLIMLISGLFLSQALALALGLRPVFVRVSTLNRVTSEFGKGKLTARYPLSTGKDEIEQLGTSFNVMAEKIISLLDSHNELLNTVAHELRTPMARLSFALELAKEKPKDLKEKLGLMEKDLFELDRLVSELLEFNRISSTSTVITEEVSIYSVCLAAASGENVLDPSVKINVIAEKKDSTVPGDYRLLQRAISNLIRNAVRHASTCVNIHITQGQNTISVSVSDDGSGFSEGFINKAVKPFVKGQNSTGSGLGLAIVTRIAEKYHGSLSLTNQKNSGAKVTLSLPLA